MKCLMLMILTALLVGCSSTSNKLEVSKLTDQERVFIGRIDLDFNGISPEKLKCELYINSDFSPSVSLSSDGYVFYKTKDHIVNFTQIGCLQKNAIERRWHIHSLNTRPLKAPAKKNIITYFGEVKIKWKTTENLASNQSDRKIASNDLVSQNRDITKIYNNGKFSMKISNYITKTKRHFFKLYPEVKSEFVVGKNLLRKSRR